MEGEEESDNEGTHLLSSTKKEHHTKKYRLITVEPALILYTVYFGGSVPLIQQYVYKKTGETLGIVDDVTNGSYSSTNASSVACEDLDGIQLDENNEAVLLEQEMQRQSSLWLASFTAVYLIPSLVTSLMLGAYCDMVGRKLSLIVSVSGACCKCVIVVIVIWLDLALPYLYIGAFLEGVFGGAATFYTGAFSYIADITTWEQRALRMIILQFSLGFGVLVTTIMTGYLLDALGYLWPFLVILIAQFINLIYIGFFLQQAMPKSADPSKAVFFQLSNFKKAFELFLVDTVDNRRWKLWIFMVLMLMFGITDLGRVDVSILFVLRSPLCFTPILIGYFAAAFYIVPSIGGVIVTKLCQANIKELGLILLGCASASASSIFFAFSAKTYLIFISCFVGLFGRLPIAMLRSYSSKVVETNEGGSLFASLAWLEGVSTIIGSLLFTFIYNATLTSFTGAVFIVIGGIYGAGFFLTLALWLRDRSIRSRNLPEKFPDGSSNSSEEKEINIH